MGFFSGITKTLTGGADSKSSSTASSGLLALPQYAQDAYKGLVNNSQSLLKGSSGANLFTPIGTTAAETQAQGLMQQPTSAQGVQSLVGQYLNPYMQSAYDTINREAEGGYSLIKQALSNSGQMGSNREIFGAINTDEARLRAISDAQRQGYDTALNTGLNQNQTNIQNLLAQGADERNLAMQTAQSPLQALQALAGILGTLPSTSNSESTAKSSSVGGFLPALSGFGK